MASSLPCFCRSLNYRPLYKKIILKHPQVRSQISRDEGKSANNNIVDANLSVLRERIEEVRTKQRLEKCMMMKIIGWNLFGCSPNNSNNNNNNNNDNFKNKSDILYGLAAEYSLELMCLASNGAIGIVFLGRTLWICLVTFIFQLSKS